MTETTITKNYDFGYEETYQGRLEFFNKIALWQLEDWFTQPIKDYGQDMSDDEKVDFIQNKLWDAYQAETDYRHEETDQECLYDIDHVVCFRMKNKPETLQSLEDESGGIYRYEVDEDDASVINIQILNEWDSWILSREAYSERMIENFCSYYGFDEDDVLDKTVSING